MTAMPLRAGRILETALYARDLEAAERFFRDVLGLEVHSRAPGRHVFFRCGQAMLLIFQPERTMQPDSGVPAHGAAGPGHVAFAIANTELEPWRERLRSMGVAIEAEIE